jgi:hypothetical protein
LAGQTKGGRKPAGFPLFGRGSVPEEEEEIAVMLPPPSAAPVARQATKAGVDLSGRPKLWFVIGPGRSGKTTLLRYVAETILAGCAGHEAMFVARPVRSSTSAAATPAWAGCWRSCPIWSSGWRRPAWPRSRSTPSARVRTI